ncbi:MAG: DNA topoisomerase IB [Saprospiraceae bacterium]|nr:DNA topoisomerase IB [Pyrinomonadaceae bacterium]
MAVSKPAFDPQKAREMIEKGHRSKWWLRKGGMSSGFHYVDSSGKKITNHQQLERIRLLVIPPAWKHVRISPTMGSRLQAVGMDTTGRVQYLYHAKFSEKQKNRKFSKIETFGKYLPRLRTVTNEHIALKGFPREKVLAVMMRLINSLYIRIGTEKSAKHYKTFGITTLQNKHLMIGRKGELVFEFVGKSHVKHRRVLVDEELASVMKQIKELGVKRKLFHYLDGDGKPRNIKPSDINEYLKVATAPEFSSKDFRTWGGTLLAAIELAEIGKSENEKELKKNINRAVKKVAEQLGNTPAVCRSSYIHPKVLKNYEAGITLDEFRTRKARRISLSAPEYEAEEKALMRLFEGNRTGL